ACGYAVRGLEALSCPECGADLRVVGINRPRASGARTIGIVLVALCGSALMLTCLSLFVWVSGSSSTTVIVPAPSSPSTTPPMTPDPVPAEAGEIDQDTPDAIPPAGSPEAHAP
ncbi:MAG: hypothetical protein MI741_02035, partial [Rhodospirillales bacterium]|nr:hypothetical protein [Rhodospirillales bacterium]